MYKVAVVGVTGAVGQEILRVLERRKFPVSELVPLASERSAGTEVEFAGKKHKVRKLEAGAFAGVQIAFFSAGATRSREFIPIARKAGAVVVDNSSAFRMDPQVPLVVPEVNGDLLDAKPGLIANPNCSAAILAVALAPLHRIAGLESVVVATYQSASGAGGKGDGGVGPAGAGLCRRQGAPSGGVPPRAGLQSFFPQQPGGIGWIQRGRDKNGGGNAQDFCPAHAEDGADLCARARPEGSFGSGGGSI